MPRFAEAAKSLEEATRLNPENTSAYNNLGFLCELQGEHEMYQLGRDPRPAFAKGVAALEEVLRRNPDHAVARMNLGDTLFGQALYERGTGAPWRDSLRRARESYRESLRANDEDYGPWLALGRTWTFEAEDRAPAGESADEAVAGAERAVRKAEALAPDSAAVLVARAGMDTLKASRAIALGADPERLFLAAEAALRKAAALEPDASEWQVDLARALEPWSAWQLAHRPAEAAATIARGAKAARRALDLSPGQPEAAAYLASFLEMQSRGERDPARRTALLEEAKDLLKRSLERAPLLAGERAPLKRALGLP